MFPSVPLHWSYSAGPSSQHVETDHNVDPVRDLSIRDVIIAHIQNRIESDSTVQSSIGEHEIAVCSNYCSASAVKDGVKRHVY
jgi:hypothetical protein